MRSANVPQGDRNPRGYTEQEILREIRGLDGTRMIDFRYEHLDRNMVRIKDLDNIIGGSVQMSYTSAIKRTATFTMRGDGDIDFLHDYVKPWMKLWMPPKLSDPYVESTREWSNSFTGASADEEVTYDRTDITGDPVDAVSGSGPGVVFSGTQSIKSNRSIRMGTAAGSSSHSFRSQYYEVATTGQLLRGYFYMDPGTHLSLEARGVDTLAYADASFEVNDSDAGGVSIGGTNHPGIASDFMGKWVRYEVQVDNVLEKCFFRFYWTNPTDLSADPDFEDQNTDAAFARKIGGFFFSYTATASSADNYIYWGPMEGGDLVDFPAVPTPTDNDWIEWPLGVFLLSSPARVSDKDDIVTRDVEAYDRSKLFIDDKLTERVAISKGENYTDIMKTYLVGHPHILEPSTAVCGRAREFEVGTPIKEVLDRIAESINYHTMQVDEDGRVMYRPYVSPADRTPEFEYADDEMSIMYPEVTEEFDIYEIANVWIVALVDSEGDGDTAPIVVKLENHDPANPFSIPRRGRKIVDYREETEADGKSQLLRKVRRIQFESNREYENLDFTTLINPLHSVNDCYNVKYSAMGINSKYTETAWEFSLEEGANMTHSCRRVVQLNPELYDGFVEGNLTVNGSITAGNIAWGHTTVPITRKNVPQSVEVTGLDLKGNGRVDVLLTPYTSVPGGTVRQVCSQEEKPTGFKIWLLRTNTTNTDIHWLAMRNL